RLQHSLQHALDGPIEAVLVHPAPEVGAGTEYGSGPREKDRPRARVHQLTHAVRDGEAFCRAQGIALVGPVESNHPDLAFAVRALLFGKTDADQGLADAGIIVLHALNITAHAHRPGGFGRSRENYRFCSEVPSYKVCGFGPRRPASPSSIAVMRCICSSVSWKPNTSALLRMRSGLELRGITTSPRWMCQRMMTCATVTPWASAMAWKAGLSRFWPCFSGDQASV